MLSYPPLPSPSPPPPQRPHPASHEEMTRYHSDDYIRFLRTIRPDNVGEYTKLMQRCEFVGVRVCGWCGRDEVVHVVTIVFPLQSMWARIVRCLTDYMSFASCPQEAPLVSCHGNTILLHIYVVLCQTSNI